jgi:uncharacterized protein (TIGR03086 family)
VLIAWEAVPVFEALGLLERSVDYTRNSLHLVWPGALGRPTPCHGWDLDALLRHMDDSLAAFTDAAEIGYVDLGSVGYDDPAAELVGNLKSRACALLGAWTNNARTGPLFVGDRPLAPGMMACAGALEIAVHGWDVAQACGVDRPLPRALARELLGVAPMLIGGADRPHRFAEPVDVPASAPAGERLMAYLGRSPALGLLQE